MWDDAIAHAAGAGLCAAFFGAGQSSIAACTCVALYTDALSMSHDAAI